MSTEGSGPFLSTEPVSRPGMNERTRQAQKRRGADKLLSCTVNSQSGDVTFCTLKNQSLVQSDLASEKGRLDSPSLSTRTSKYIYIYIYMICQWRCHIFHVRTYKKQSLVKSDSLARRGDSLSMYTVYLYLYIIYIYIIYTTTYY